MPRLGKGTLDTWRCRLQRGGRTQSRHKPTYAGGTQQWVNHGSRAYVGQRLNSGEVGKAHCDCQCFKPDPGNPAVRDYRGAFGNVAMVEMRSQLANRKSELVTLHLKLARRSSI